VGGGGHVGERRFYCGREGEVMKWEDEVMQWEGRVM